VPAFDRANPASWWRTDFELGNVPLPTGGAK